MKRLVDGLSRLRRRLCFALSRGLRFARQQKRLWAPGIKILENHYAHLSHSQNPTRVAIITFPTSSVPTPEFIATCWSILSQTHDNITIIIPATIYQAMLPALPQLTSRRVKPLDSLDEIEKIIDNQTFFMILGEGELLTPDAVSELLPHAKSSAEDSSIVFSDDYSSLGFQIPKPSWSPILSLSKNLLGPATLFSPSRLKVLAKQTSTGDVNQLRYRLAYLNGAEISFTRIPIPLASVRCKNLPEVPPHEAEACAAQFFSSTEIAQFTQQPPYEKGEPGTVSIIIPTRDNPALLDRCVQSIVAKSARWQPEILIVDNGSVKPETLHLMERLARTIPNLRILRDPAHFNFSRLCNLGARTAKGQSLLFLNDDTEVQTDNWLSPLAALAQLPHIGPVGCLLRYPDGTIQHAGIAGLAALIAGHPGKYQREPCGEAAWMLTVTREVLAVSAAALFIRKERFWSVGGFCETRFPNAWSDVDLCLRLWKNNLFSVYTPHVQITHHESISRQTQIEDHERMALCQLWPEALLNDPFWHPNFRSGEALSTSLAGPRSFMPRRQLLDLIERRFSPQKVKIQRES